MNCSTLWQMQEGWLGALTSCSSPWRMDQLDLLDIEEILTLRSISQRCAERIGNAAHILEAQNKILYEEERANDKPRENER